MAEDLSRYCFDGGPFALLTVVLFLIFASIFCIRAIREGSTGSRFNRWEQKTWRELLLANHVTADEGEAEAFLPPVLTAWGSLHPPALLGAAVGLVVACAVLCTVSALTTGSLLLLTAYAYMPAYGSAFLLGAVGYTIGLSCGAARVRARNRSGSRHGDLRPRLLISYRSRRIPLVLVIALLFYVVMTVVVAPHVSPNLHIDTIGGAQFLIPRSSFSLAAPLICMGLAIVGMEMLQARIVSLPRIATGLGPSLALQIDDLIRSRVVMKVAGAEVLVVAALGWTQLLLTDFDLGDVHIAAVQLVSSGGLFVSMALAGLGIVPMLSGEAAVTLTGWFYSPRRRKWQLRSS